MKTPAENVIEKFGGLTKMARLVSSPVSTVQGWKERGRIPQDRWLAIIDAAKAEAIDLTLEDFLVDPVPAKAGEAA